MNNRMTLEIEREFTAGWALFCTGATLDSATCIATTDLGDGRNVKERVSFEARDGFEAAQKYGKEAATMGQCKEAVKEYLAGLLGEWESAYNAYAS
jgi:hypothetical protein